MGEIANKYLTDMFISSRWGQVEETIEVVDGTVTMEMNRSLLLPYTAEEITQAVFQMHPSKVLGLDGISSLFFQKFWHIVGYDVVKVVLSVLT